MNSKIDYEHSKNVHTLEGAKSALPQFFTNSVPNSILDVGCGTGVWLRAALDYGITDVFGIDGVNLSAKQLLFDFQLFKTCDLTSSVTLGRTYDLVICLEVAEHLDEKFASVLIETLTKHSNNVVFSAACPAQPGQHHVNCQWPSYWQNLFNSAGFVCNDLIRRQIWNDPRIEIWYRQNVFMATRSSDAGSEPRIPSIIHPEMYEHTSYSTAFAKHVMQIEHGRMPAEWYFTTPLKAILHKLKRQLK